MIEYRVDDMSCGHCEKAIRQAVRDVDPGARVEVSLTTHRVSIDSEQAPARFAAALTEAGYTPVAIDG